MSLTGILTSRWFVSFIGAATIAGLAWYFGPLLAPFESMAPRLVLVLTVLLLWVAVNFLTDLLARRKDQALAEGVVAGTGEAGAKDEAEALRAKLAAGLQLLRKANRSRGYLYEQPWYVIIGPPGAGKTTALLNAGLRFPLAAKMGTDPLAGVGGTRSCDWWFAEDAVLIDTAGRYTTRDSDAAADKAGWDAFLDLLKSTRSRQPLNGVIVVIALSDVAQGSADERMAHASAVHRRVDELYARLGIRLPVYILFTKADLIAGFSEFFEDLGQEARAQVWGTTFDPGASGGYADLFARAFRSLIERLDTRLFERLLTERNPQRRPLIAMFPSQVASLELPLVEFLRAAFAEDASGRAPLVRGAYLSSATQEGRPFDRLAGTLARVFGLEQQRAASLRPDQGRSYFLQNLLREVIFREAMLVSAPPIVERRRFALRAAGFAALALVVVASGLYLWHLREDVRTAIDTAEGQLQAYEQVARTLKLDPVSDADLPRLLPLLNQARAFQPDPVAADSQPVSWTALGLSQDAKLAAGAGVMYRHALERALLPRLVWQMEAQIRDNLQKPDFLYEGTRVYLMLGGVGPLDRPLVKEWMRLAWQSIYPGVAYAPFREQLLLHLDALLAEPLPPVALDGNLVAAARDTFAKISLSQRAYARIRLSVGAQRIAPWRPSDALGPVGIPLFTRASGKPLTDGIPGLYTVNGFHQVLLPSLSKVVKGAVSESWVAGQRTNIDPNGPRMSSLEHEVIELYENDYAQLWDAMMADLSIAPLTSISQAARDLYIIASPQSPLRSLLVSIVRQLSLSISSDQGQVKTATPVGEAPAANIDLRLLLGSGQSDTRSVAPGYEIDQRYATLRSLVTSDAGSPIDQVLRSMNDMQQQFAKAAASAASNSAFAASTANDPTLALQAEALRQPQPLARWLTTLANSGALLRRTADQKR